MPSLPDAMVPLLSPFASLFDARTWRKVQILLTGVVLAPADARCPWPCMRWAFRRGAIGPGTTMSSAGPPGRPCPAAGCCRTAGPALGADRAGPADHR